MGPISEGFTRRGVYVVAIVQARLGASRLPGKMLADLHGEPVLKWTLCRVAQAKHVDAIVVATPDKRLSDLAYGWGAWGYWWRGDQSDVLGRYAAAAKWCNAEIVVRITGDCPLVDPAIIDQALESLGSHDFVSTVLRRNQERLRFPKGCEVEVIPNHVLQDVNATTTDVYGREHVTSRLYKPGAGHVLDLSTPPADPLINWCVDTPSDLDRMRMIFHTVDEVWKKGYREIVDDLRRDAGDRQRPGGDSPDHEPDEGRQAAV